MKAGTRRAAAVGPGPAPARSPTARRRARRPAARGTRSWRGRAPGRARARLPTRERTGRAAASRHPPEPERRERAAEEEKRSRAACEVVRDLARLLPASEPRAKSLVDGAEADVVARGEELAAGGAGQLPARPRPRRDPGLGARSGPKPYPDS